MNESSPRPSRRFPWRTAVVAGAVVLLGALGLVAYLRTLDSARQLARAGGDLARQIVTNAPAVAEKFRTGRLTQTFRESIPQIHPTGGDVLELATTRSDETFTQADERWIGWDFVYLGTTVAEIRVPVTFRYHVRLSDPWRLAVRDQVCLVLAPRIRPSLPPAIHTDGIEKRAESGWARFDGGAQLAQLEQGLTKNLSLRAADTSHLALVREACRQSVANFVRNWLLKEDQWRQDRFRAIRVVFPDELPGQASRLPMAEMDIAPFLEEVPGPPTISLESGTSQPQ